MTRGEEYQLDVDQSELDNFYSCGIAVHPDVYPAEEPALSLCPDVTHDMRLVSAGVAAAGVGALLVSGGPWPYSPGIGGIRGSLCQPEPAGRGTSEFSREA